MNNKPRRGSAVWLMVIETAVNLQRIADALDPNYIRGHTNFITAVRHVVTFAGIAAHEVAHGAGCSIDEVQQWVCDDIHKNREPPSRELRGKVLLSLRDAVRNRANELLGSISHPPK